MANNYRFELIVCDFMQNGKKKVVEEFPPLLCAMPVYCVWFIRPAKELRTKLSCRSVADLGCRGRDPCW